MHRPNPVAEYSTFVLGARGKGRRGGKMRGETSVARDPIKWRLINSRAQNACETCASIGSVIIKTLPTTTPTDITLIIPFGLPRFLSGSWMETLAARELCSISWLKYTATWPRGNRFQWNVKISWRGEKIVCSIGSRNLRGISKFSFFMYTQQIVYYVTQNFIQSLEGNEIFFDIM